MTEQEARNLATVRAAYEEHKYFDAADERTELHEALSLPYGGTYRGPEAMTFMLQRMRATWGRPGGDGKSTPTLHTEIEYTVGGDMVIAHMMFGGIGKKTGRSFGFPIVEMWRFRDDGVIDEVRPFYFDAALAAECFGC
jgi:uncharacterized protein